MPYNVHSLSAGDIIIIRTSTTGRRADITQLENDIVKQSWNGNDVTFGPFSYDTTYAVPDDMTVEVSDGAQSTMDGPVDTIPQAKLLSGVVLETLALLL